MIKIFVGSSSETKLIDTDIRRVLEDQDTRPINWSTQFRAGEFGLESLERVKKEADAALLISTPDDRVWYRGAEGFSPRDNILFELGIFISELGRDRVGLVVAENAKGEVAKIPTDLSGLNYIHYRHGREATNSDALTKWVLRIKSGVATDIKDFENPFDVLTGQFARLPEDWKDDIQNYILTPFRNQSYAALTGEFQLDISQYYSSLFSALATADPSQTKIKAISLLSHEIWDSDPFQVQYLDYNVQARRDGVSIQRIFVIREAIDPNLWNTIQKLMDNDIDVRVVDSRLFSKFPNLDDMVLFRGKQSSRCYISRQFFSSANRLRSGNLNLNTNYCNELAVSFDALWKLGSRPSIEAVKTEQPSVDPPGHAMETFSLDCDVITCQEAADAKGIPLANELKTLLAKTSQGVVAIHVPGDSDVSWNAVKTTLDVEQAYLLPADDLAALHLSPGTVSAIMEPVWSFSHLISKRVLSLEYVSTNKGSPLS